MRLPRRRHFGGDSGSVIGCKGRKGESVETSTVSSAKGSWYPKRVSIY